MLPVSQQADLGCAEMFGFLDNCVNYGADVLSTNTEYRRCVIEVFEMCMTSRMLGAEDRVIACKLAEALLLRLRGQVDEVSPLCIWKRRSEKLTSCVYAGHTRRCRAVHVIRAVEGRR